MNGFIRINTCQEHTSSDVIAKVCMTENGSSPSLCCPSELSYLNKIVLKNFNQTVSCLIGLHEFIENYVMRINILHRISLIFKFKKKKRTKNPFR